MSGTEKDLSPTEQVETARKAFETEYERFARFTDNSAASNMSLEQALEERRSLAELRTRHLGKKSSLAATRKLISRVAPDERAAFGQLVQAIEVFITEKVDAAEQSLKESIAASRTALESIDVTLPGRRPR